MQTYISESDDLFSALGENPVFIFPSRIFGGHELMAVEIIKKIMLQASVTIFVDPTNYKLQEYITSIPNLTLHLIPFTQPHFEFIHALLNPVLKLKSKKFIYKLKQKKYSKIFIVQGDIELGCLILEAAIENDANYISYIPYTHSAKKMGKRLHRIRDLYYKNLYSRTKKFATISEVFRMEIKKLSINSEILLFRNSVRDLEHFKSKKNLTKNSLYKIYIIGRVSFRQKGHDILIHALSMLPKYILEKIELNIIGDGEDLQLLDRLILTQTNKISMINHGWHSEPWEIAFDADLLVIPSRFEGVPLVMLEALELKIDILATRKDGMIEYLPETHLFNNSEELAAKLYSRLK